MYVLDRASKTHLHRRILGGGGGELKVLSNKAYEQSIASAIDATRASIVEDVTKAMKAQAQSGPASYIVGINPTGNGAIGEAEPTNKEDYLRTLQRHPWTRAAIRKVALSAVANKWGIVEAEGYEGKGNEANKKMLQKLFKRPNPKQSMTDLFIILVSLLKSKGEGYWEIVRNGKGDPAEFYPLQGRIDIICDKHGNLQSPAYKQNILNGYVASFEKEDVLPFRWPNPFGGMHGSSDMESLELPLAIDLNALNWNNKFFSNNTMPPGVWELPDGVGEEQFKAATLALDTQVKGVQNAHKSAIVTSFGTKYTAIATSPKDLEFAKGREQTRDEILAVLGVPKSKLGISDGVNLANGKEQSNSFYTDEVEPIQTLIEETLNQWIYEEFGIEDWIFRFNRPDFTNEETDAKVDEIYIKNAIRSTNEIRTKRGWEPLPYAWADIPFLMTSQGPVFMIDGIEKPIDAPVAVANSPDQQEPTEEDLTPPEDLKQAKALLSSFRKTLTSLLPSRGGVAHE